MDLNAHVSYLIGIENPMIVTVRHLKKSDPNFYDLLVLFFQSRSMISMKNISVCGERKAENGCGSATNGVAANRSRKKDNRHDVARGDSINKVASLRNSSLPCNKSTDGKKRTSELSNPEAELILEANRLQLMKQDWRKRRMLT
ncbi:hypothetical protein TNCV_4730871 [Trichonephila clavipes]|nr:hypothetical protein TNCV_4730871 [Trichonephila clavipes]